MVGHTSFYVFDTNIWKKAKMLADAQNITRTRLLWNALVVYLEDKCPLGSMDAYLNVAKVIRIDPHHDKTRAQINEKIREFPTEMLDKQQDWAMMYLKCLQKEVVNRA